MEKHFAVYNDVANDLFLSSDSELETTQEEAKNSVMDQTYVITKENVTKTPVEVDHEETVETSEVSVLKQSKSEWHESTEQKAKNEKTKDPNPMSKNEKLRENEDDLGYYCPDPILKEYHCKSCEYKSFQKGQMRKHIKKDHTDEPNESVEASVNEKIEVEVQVETQVDVEPREPIANDLGKNDLVQNCNFLNRQE